MLTGPACDRRRCNRPGDIPNLRNMRTLPTLLLISFALATSAQGFAMQVDNSATPNVTPPAASVRMQCTGITLSQAVEQVRRQYKGRIVSAETKRNGDSVTHVIKVLTVDGKVKTVRVPG